MGVVDMDKKCNGRATARSTIILALQDIKSVDRKIDNNQTIRRPTAGFNYIYLVNKKKQVNCGIDN